MKNKKLSLLRLTWPLFVEMLMLMLMGNADVFMISRYSEDAVVAVGVANQFVQFSIIMFGFVSAGAMVIISQLLGAKKETEAKNVAGTAILCNLVFGLIVSLGFIFASPLILRLMDLEPPTMASAITFLRMVGGFIFLQAVLTCINTILRSYGNTRDPLIVTIAMNIISIIGNALFLFGFFGLPVLGVFGVALSTSVSRMAALVLALFLLFKYAGNPFKHIKKEEFLGHVKKILAIGIPSAGENLSFSGYQIFLTSIITTMGTVAIAARIYTKVINMFMFLAVLSLSQAGQIIMGHLMGQKAYDTMYKKAFKHLKFGLFSSVISVVVFFLLSPYLLRIFTNNEEIIALARIVFAIFLFQEIGRVFNLVLITSLRAAGDVQFPVYIGICVMWGVGAFLGFLLGVVFEMGLVGVVIASSLDECVRGTFMFFRWKSRKWANKGVT